MSKNYKFTDRKFQELTSNINKVIIQNKDKIGDQKKQVELLFAQEKKFKYHISQYKQLEDIYAQFIGFIINENGNILSAKPYFREKSEVFNSEISSAIKNKNNKELIKFDINFKMIDFIVKRWRGNLPPRAKKYYDELKKTRNILIENNLPLAINRAKLFYRKTSRSHLSLLDLIDICTYGLITGIDKYVGDYSRVWRSVCIGRMVGYMIEEYSKTFLRMYPVDRKILYRANALKFRLKIEDVSELTKAVNESFEKDKAEGKPTPKLPIQEIHISTLINGSSYVSADNKSENDDQDNHVTIYEYVSDEDQNIEKNYINRDLMNKIIIASKKLSIMEKKIIKLKGVTI